MKIVRFRSNKSSLFFRTLGIVAASISFALCVYLYFLNQSLTAENDGLNDILMKKKEEMEEIKNLYSSQEVQKNSEMERSDENMEENRDCFEYYTSEISLSENISETDKVDVRIVYPNAEDYSILIGKEITLMEKGITVNISEDEILLLSSAVYDKKNYPGTDIYAVKCADGKRCTENVPSYIPCSNILILLSQEGDTEKRINLESRLEDTY